MEGGSLVPDFSSDGSGRPDNKDSPDGNLHGVLIIALEIEIRDITCIPACPPTPPELDAL